MRRCFVWPVLLLSILASIPAHADLIITPVFDSSITSDPNAAGIESTIEGAISVFESTYSDPIDVLIYFQELQVSGGLGESNYVPTAVPYQTFYSHLVAANANPTAIAGLTANGGAGIYNPVTGTPEIEIKPANAAALGIASNGANLPNCYLAAGSAGVPEQCSTVNNGTSPVDGIVSLETSITYPPGSNNGASYGLLSTTEHEIDEILGLGSALANSTSPNGAVTATDPLPEDLFRYGADGSRIFSVNCAAAATAFFSYNGATDLAQFNNACNGGDFGDWQSSPLPNGVAAQVQDAFTSPGAQPLYGPNEIAALSAIGYTVVAPEPGTWFLLSMALPAFVIARKRAAGMGKELPGREERP